MDFCLDNYGLKKVQVGEITNMFKDSGIDEN